MHKTYDVTNRMNGDHQNIKGKEKKNTGSAQSLYLEF